MDAEIKSPPPFEWFRIEPGGNLMLNPMLVKALLNSLIPALVEAIRGAKSPHEQMLEAAFSKLVQDSGGKILTTSENS